MARKKSIQAIIGPPKKKVITPQFTHHVLAHLYHTNASFILQAPMRSTTLCVHAPSLCRHLGSRVTRGELDEALTLLYKWKALLSLSYGADMYVLVLNPPRGMRPDTHDELGRVGAHMEAFMALARGVKKKARLYDMATSRMLKALP